MAIVKAVAPAIYDAIEEKEVASLLLTQHVLPKGESAKYDKVREVKAYWVAKGGQVHQSNVGDEEVEFTIDRVASAPTVDISILQNGDIYRLTDIILLSGIFIANPYHTDMKHRNQIYI